MVDPDSSPSAGSPGQSPAAGLSVLATVLLAVGLIFGILAAAGLVFLGLEARQAARRSHCISHMRQMTLALHNYYDVYHTFPPSYIPDKDGRPMHSWRVLILPFIEQQPLHAAYNFDEPWDGPNNRRLAPHMPPSFRCPSNPDQTSLFADYAMIVGEQTISDGPTARRFGHFTGGLANTLFIVEAGGQDIHWMEPRDLPFDALTFQINDGTRPGVSSYHPGGVNVGMCDGRVLHLPDTYPPEMFRGMATIDGGERTVRP